MMNDNQARSIHRKRKIRFPSSRNLALIIVLVLLLQSCSLNIQDLLPNITNVPKVATQFNTTVATSVPVETIDIATSAPPPIAPTFTPTPEPTLTLTPAPTGTSTEMPPVVFAAIADYGSGQGAEADVAKEVISWEPEFVITMGDNNYPVGSAETIDEYIGQFYHDFINPYNGSYGDGADVNRFFPALGNHDMMTENGKPYFDYFTLPGNERYYDFVWGPMHLFSINTLDNEPDGVAASSAQAEWLKKGLADSTSPWNIVYMHYSPYSSGLHGPVDWMRWPYKEWGADIVLSAHDHTYERLEVDGLTYIVNGLGGGGIYDFMNILDSSQVRYNSDWGALKGEATDHYLKFEFITRSGEIIDTYELNK